MKLLLQTLIGWIKCKANHIKYTKETYIGINVKIINREGGRFELKPKVIIRPSCDLFVHKLDSHLSIGEGTEIGNHSTISAQNSIVIEDNVLTAPNVYIADHNHEYEDIHIPICQQGTRCSPCSRVVIGSGTWLGKNVVVAGNVKIGRNCVIGANSVVTKDIPDYCVAAGVPAKEIRKYDPETRQWAKTA